MSITIQTRTNYGTESHYPVCEKAQSFAQIAGTKTLTVQTLKLIQMLGYDIVQKPITRSF
jgi:hypothetical protein